MKMHYEAPEAEIVNFKARENLAIIEENVGPTPEIGVGSLDFEFD